MAIEKGITAKLEDWIASGLSALEYDGSAVFSNAKPWEHQYPVGPESLKNKGRIAIVRYEPTNAAREGDYNLRDILEFSVAIVVSVPSKGINRRGNSKHLGASKIRDLVIDNLDGSHPGDGFNCDELYYVGEANSSDTPEYYLTYLFFRINQMR